MPAEQQNMNLQPRPPRRERTNSEQRTQRQTIANEKDFVRNNCTSIVWLYSAFQT